jgi:hypothetical protein
MPFKITTEVAKIWKTPKLLITAATLESNSQEGQGLSSTIFNKSCNCRIIVLEWNSSCELRQLGIAIRRHKNIDASGPPPKIL